MRGHFIWTKLKLVTVEPILFMYMLVIFMESNALQELIYVKSCLKLSDLHNISDCDPHKKENNTLILGEAAYWTRSTGAFLFLSTFISSFYVASWSDKFGRKFPMIIPPLGTAIAASINCALSVFMDAHIAYFFISSVISGITFGTVGIIASTFGFVSDISDESSRTKRMVILEAMIYTGGTLGIYIGGEFLKHSDYTLQLNGFSKLFILEICIAVIISIYIMIRIPKHTGAESDTSISCGTLFQLNHVKDTLKTVFQPRNGGQRKIILLLLLALFFIYFGLVVQFTLAYYFVKAVHGLQWDMHKYSIFNSVQFAVEGLTLLLGMPVFFHFLHAADHLIAILGIISKMAGYIVFGLSFNDAMVYSCIGLYMFSEYPVPVIRSMLSKIVDVDEKGRIFAFTTIMQNFCFLCGSLTLTSVFRETESFFPGMCFEIVAALQIIAMLIVMYLYITRSEVITTYEIMENEDGSVEEICSVGNIHA